LSALALNVEINAAGWPPVLDKISRLDGSFVMPFDGLIQCGSTQSNELKSYESIEMNHRTKEQTCEKE